MALQISRDSDTCRENLIGLQIQITDLQRSGCHVKELFVQAVIIGKQGVQETLKNFVAIGVARVDPDLAVRIFDAGAQHVLKGAA